MDFLDDIRDIFEEIISDEEEDFLNVVGVERRPQIYRQRTNHMEYWDDKSFLQRFRLPKATVELLNGQIRHLLEHPTDRNHALDSLTQLLVALRFYATSSFEKVIGDFTGVHESTVCQVIKKVSRAICSLAPVYIRLPETPEEIQETKNALYTIARFPGAIGAVDCTHIRIQSPGGDNAEHFRNRKGYFSVNVQTVSDAGLKITNIVARWPGSANDRTIFANSRLRALLEQGHFDNSFLLGDSGYTLSQYMMIPVANPQTRAEMLFNESQIRTRNVVERQYGVWKRRFPVLRLELRLKLSTTLTVIVATAVLHNLAISRNDEEPLDDPYEEAPEIPDNIYRHQINGIRVRENLINEYFAQL